MRNIAKDTPTEKVKDMRIEGLSNDDIIKALKPNYANREVNDAMNQADQDIPGDNILEELDTSGSGPDLPSSEDQGTEELLEEAPAPDEDEEQGLQQKEYPKYGVSQSMSIDQMQEVIEAVVEEKWEDLTSKMGDLNIWKESINNDIESLKQELLRTQERLHNLQNVMVGKVTEYSKNINDIGTEMKALEQVFQRILQPLTSNIKDLNKVTEELKSRGHHSGHHEVHKTHEVKQKVIKKGKRKK
ncbi:MAG: hypothetical protein AABW56_02195 [Nanoarchaeota archaeon]